MATRPNDDARNFGADRERQREVSNDGVRSARSSLGDPPADGATSQRDSARGRSNRGFASMDRSKQREIASKGGRAAHEKGTAHEFDSGEARAAGRKGGVTVSQNREHMAAIGRRGGEARGANRAARLQQNGDAGTSASQPSSQNGQRFATDREVNISRDSGLPLASSNGRPAARSSGSSLGGERASAQSAEGSVERL